MIRFPVLQHKPQRIARFLAKSAVRALYEELALYPKPGLVSLVDAGAHEDMDAHHFFKSLFALRHYFYQVALAAAEGVVFPELVLYGLHAEQRMLAVTGGINTHRGAIFALGIVCATVAKLWQQKQACTLVELQQKIQSDWADYLYFGHRNEGTHGAVVQQKYQVPDAKHLAIIGYAPVLQIFAKLYPLQAQDKNFWGLLIYKELLLVLDDINILYRLGPEGLVFARQHMSGIDQAYRQQSWIHAQKTHHLFCQKRISPGGVADMLALCYFLSSISSDQGFM